MLFQAIHPFHIGKSALRCWALTMTLATLAGCADMSGIAPKAVMLDPQAIEELTLAPVSPNELTVGWWHEWKDPQLNQLVQHSLNNNPTLKMARSRVDLANSLVELQGSRRFPSFSAGTNFSRVQYSETWYFPPPIGGGVYWDNLAALNLAFDLDLWGKQRSLMGASINERQAAEAEADWIRLSLVTAVVQAYAQLDLQWQLLDIASDDLQRIEQILVLDRRKMQAGLVAGQEIGLLDAALERQKSRVESLETSVKLAQSQLAALAGLGDTAAKQIHRPQLPDAMSIELPAQIDAEVVGHRPDVEAQRWRIEAQGKRVDAAKADFLPNVNLLGFIGFQGFGFTQLFSSQSGTFGIGPAVSLPIFDGGLRRGKLGAETSAKDEVVESYNQTLIRALQEIADDVLLLKSNRQELTYANNSLNALNSRYDAINRGWRGGVTSYREVLNARGLKNEAREALVRKGAYRRHAYASLMKDVAGRFDTGQPEQASAQVAP